MMVEEQQVAAPRADGGALNQLIWGFAVSQAVYVAAKLSIVDTVGGRAQSAREIAAAVGAQEPSLRRLLRALTAIDILVEDQDGRFAATPTSALLGSDHPQSVRAFAMCMGGALVWRAWGELCAAVQTGTPAFDQVYGEPFFARLGGQPEDAALFNAAMTDLSKGDLPAILAPYDFRGVTKVVDVGGGQGELLRGILEQYPQATGVLFDQLPVVAEAQILKGSTVVERCAFVGGDMFRAIPPGGDVYMSRFTTS
jgi:hypothetical protein